jgi:hypothetical protein
MVTTMQRSKTVRCGVVSRMLRWAAIPVERLAAIRNEREGECEQHAACLSKQG